MPEGEKEPIIKKLAGRAIRYYQVYREDKSYLWKAKSIQDTYEKNPKYLYKISSVSENAISKTEIKDHFKPFIDYLYKAIEIARRDPYCSRVVNTSFSLYESKPNRPIVYVHYENLNGGDAIFHYTLQEINHLYPQINDL